MNLDDFIFVFQQQQLFSRKANEFNSKLISFNDVIVCQIYEEKLIFEMISFIVRNNVDHSRKVANTTLRKSCV